MKDTTPSVPYPVWAAAVAREALTQAVLLLHSSAMREAAIAVEGLRNGYVPPAPMPPVEIVAARAFLDTLIEQLPAFPGKSPKLQEYTDTQLAGLRILGGCLNALESSHDRWRELHAWPSAVRAKFNITDETQNVSTHGMAYAETERKHYWKGYAAAIDDVERAIGGPTP